MAGVVNVQQLDRNNGVFLKRKGSYIPSYIIRKIDPVLWHRVKVKALQEKRTIKEVLESLIAAWLKEKRP